MSSSRKKKKDPVPVAQPGAKVLPFPATVKGKKKKRSGLLGKNVGPPRVGKERKNNIKKELLFLRNPRRGGEPPPLL